LLAIRTHVDTTPDHLRGVEAMLEVKRRVAPYIDLQLVAFPQDGLYRTATGRDNVIRALDMGVDVVGGIPHFERTMEEGAESLRDLARIAAERGPDVGRPLRRNRRSDEPPCGDHGARGDAAWPWARGRRAAPDLDAFDGQLLCVSKLLPLIAESA
jgi:cytosine/creatinine deaminase